MHEGHLVAAGVLATGRRPAPGDVGRLVVRVPDEQEGTKAVVRAWLKQPGDTVALNDPLVEL